MSIFSLQLLIAFLNLVGGSIPPAVIKQSSVESSPNPISQQYPNAVTGTINGTIAVIPIPYSLARDIIPSKYGILRAAYESLLPSFPDNSYPLVVKSILDHDIRVEALNLSIPDFQSVHLKFPFVDLIGDGYSNFAWENYLLITSTNQAAIDGSAAYGQTPVPAEFDPLLEAYKYAQTATGKYGMGSDSKRITFNAFAPDAEGTPLVRTNFTPLPSIGPWPLNFYVNVTNQPIFGNGAACDQQITFYNTTLSTDANSPVGIRGEIEIKKPYLQQDKDSCFTNVYGIKVDIAFIENNYLDCHSLKGC